MVTAQRGSPPSRGRDLLGCSAAPSASEGWTGESAVSAAGQSEQLTAPGAVAPPPAGRWGTARSLPHPPILKGFRITWENWWSSALHSDPETDYKPAYITWAGDAFRYGSYIISENASFPTCHHAAAEPLSGLQKRLDLSLVHPQGAA